MKLKLIEEQGYLYTEDKKWHLPLNNNPIIPNLGLLPEMAVEDDVRKLAKEDRLNTGWGDDVDLPYTSGFIRGYKAATKVYSEEDAEKIYMLGYMDAKDGKNHHNEKLSDYLQSLKKPTPTWFVAEMQTTKSEVFRENDNVPYATLKTTTINGKTYLVGKFENE
jgi:hypothetical protein